jgi:hypothetical protein
MKATVEVSANTRVKQTALLAAQVNRSFASETGVVVKSVPGSFYEFITRSTIDNSGELDLTFDSGNATGIFQVTNAV